MTPDERLERDLERGLHDLAGTGHPTYLDSILGHTSRSRQRRAWPLPGIDAFPRRVPPWRTGTTGWRISQMAPLFRFATIASVALALGIGLAPLTGRWSLDILADPSPSPAASPSPTAAAIGDPMAAAWVTGTVQLAPSCSGPNLTIGSGVEQFRDYRCEPQVWTTDDPRLSGEATATWNADVYRANGANISVMVGTYDLRNEAGAWACAYRAAIGQGAGLFTDAGNDETNVCVGSGAYGGLTAVVALDARQTPVTITAFIFPGELPPAP